MMIDLKYDFGTVVYLKTDPDQFPRILISCVIMPNNLIQYNLSCAGEETVHYDFEFTTEKEYA